MPAPPYPAAYPAEAYVAWHESVFPADAPLVARLNGLRDQIKTDSREDLDCLSLLLESMVWRARSDYSLSRRISVHYTPSLPEALTEPTKFDVLFKPTASILDKMWRKNSCSNPQCDLAAVPVLIGDLLRSDVTASSLDGAGWLVQRLTNAGDLIDPANTELRVAYDARIEAIQFDSEMKMESGYFAYHGAVRFRSGRVMEIQVYSELMKTWRKLSHLEYARLRQGAVADLEFGSRQARLVSLGHLLHLAECELQRLSGG